jgi:hypothetical protein
MRKRGLLVTSAFVLTTMFSLLQPQSSFAAGTITVTNVPTISSSTKNTSLGMVIMTIPEYALKAGDQVTLTLPKGFTFNSPFEPEIKTPWNPLNSANGSYMIAGFGHDGFEGTATSLGNNMVTIKVSKTGTPTDDFKLAIKLGDIKLNGVSDGPVNLSFDAPSTSAFPTTSSKPSPIPTTQPTNTGSTTKEPSSTPASKSANTLKFVIGESTYSVNNTTKSMDVVPYVDANNRLMLPLRFTANALGVAEKDFTWNAETQTATLIKDNHFVSFTAGQLSFKLNGQSIKMDSSLEIKDNRVMVPVRYLSEALGFTASWESGSKTVTLTFK